MTKKLLLITHLIVLFTISFHSKIWSQESSNFIMTTCNSISSFPHFDNFNSYGSGTVVFPTCWTKISVGSMPPYISSSGTPSNGVLNISNPSNGNYSYVIMPRIDTSIALNSLKMYFKLKSSSLDDSLQIGIMTDSADINTFTMVSKYTVPTAGAFYQIETLFGSYTGSGSFIAFKSFYGPTNSIIYIDDIFIDYLPPCPKPTNLSITNITSTTVDLQWSENGSASTWIIEYGPVGFISGTGTQLSGITNHPITISNLTPQTQYQFIVKSDCGSGTTSLWSDAITVNTGCSMIVNLPWSDFFDSYGVGSNVFPTCWTKNSTINFQPYVHYTTFSGGGALSFYANTSGSYNIAATPMISSQIQIDTLVATFKYKSTNSLDTLYVGVMSDPTNAATFETIAKVKNSINGIWIDKMVFFTNYTGLGRYIAFKVKYNGTIAYGNIDNLTIKNVPSCIMPTQLTASNITPSSLSLGWTEMGSASTWIIEYGPSGFIPGTGSILANVTTNPININGLNPQTAYQFYVKSNCGIDTSERSAPLSIMTECGIITQIPWEDSFDLYGNGSSLFPTCWTNASSIPNNLNISLINNTAPYSLLFSCGSNGQYNYLITPQLDLTIPINTLVFEFKMLAIGLDDTLYIGVMSSLTDTSNFELITQLTANETGVFENKGVNLNLYQGTGKYIVLKSSFGLTSSSIFIDDFQVINIPSCSRPITLSVTNVSDISADLLWTEDDTATSWKVEYGPTGFIPGTGTIITGLTDTMVSIYGLTPQTVYQFYAFAECDSGNVSLGSNPYTFMTACAPIQSLPYIENFDSYGVGSSVYPTCWRKLSSYGTASFPNLNATDFSSPASLYFFAGNSGYFNIAIAPSFDSTIQVNTLRATFKYRVYGVNDTLYVGVINNVYDPNSFVTIAKITSTSASTWKDGEVDFSSYTGLGRNIAFKTSCGTTSSAIYLDNLKLDLIPTCLKPTNLTTNTVQANSFYFGFTENGSATNWIIEYGPVGFMPGIGFGTTISGVITNPFFVTGLNALTNYDFYVKSDCGGGDVSIWSTPITVSTTCALISTLPWTAYFDTFGTGTSSFPTCWTKKTNNSPYPYISNPYYSYPGSLNFNANNFATYTIASTPMFDSSIPINTLKAEFKMLVSGLDDTLYVGVMTNPLDANTFELVSKINATVNNSWLSYEIFFNNYTGSGKYLAFKNKYGATSSNIYLDNLEVMSIPFCTKPTQLSSSNQTAHSAVVNWAENGTATSWNIQYGPTGFTLGTGTIISATTTNPHLISNLNGQTSYEFYVQSICGSDVSVWSNVGSFMTACGSITNLPWSEYFDTYGTASNIFPQCWIRNTSVQNVPYISTWNFSPPGSLYFNANSFGAYNIAVTPMIDQSIQLNTLKTEFKLRVLGLDDTLLVGVMTDPLDTSTFETVAQLVLNTTYSWQDVQVFFNNYFGIGKYIAFKTKYASTSSIVYIDNLTIDIIPSCPRPTNLTANNSTTTSVQLSWTEVGSATSWRLEYGPFGFTPGNGNVMYVNSNQITINTLQHSTCYDYYVHSMCSTTDSSLISNKGFFCTTQFPAIVPVDIDFETPSGILVANNPTGNNFYIGTDTANTVNNTLGGQNALYISNDNGLTNAYSTSTSAVIWAYRDVKFSHSSANYTFSFDWRASGESNYDFLNVYIGDTVTPISSINSTISVPPNAFSIAYNLNDQTNWQTATFSLPFSSFSGQTKRIYFCWRNDAIGGTQPPVAIDNIKITSTGLLTCPSPTNLTSSSITTTTALISWTPGDLETSWELEYKLTNASSWTTVSITTNPTHLLTFLTPASNYQVRVRAICEVADSSLFTQIYSFTTTSIPCPIPNNLHVTNITNHAARVSWTPGGYETSWQVEYKLGSSSIWNSLLSYSITIPIFGLQINSNYEVRVKALCPQYESVYTETVLFTTLNEIDGIEENELSQLVEIFPNPTTSIIELRLKADDLHVTECKIYDMYGKLMRVIPIHAEITSIDVSDYASGVYIIHIESERGTIFKKFVKK